MIAAWMIYTTAVTLLIFAAARAADYVVRAIGAPARFVWAASMIAALVLSGRALVGGLRTTHDAPARVAPSLAINYAVARDHGVSSHAVPRVIDPPAPTRIESFIITARERAAAVPQAAARVDVTRLERWNTVLLALWIGASSAALLWLAVSITGVHRLARGLASAVVDEHPVLVSKDIGPALFGIMHARIVLPQWVLALPRPERDIILAHEHEHAAAYDPATIYAAAFALALQPWNVALWALFARLRLAVEGDCDRRVLGVRGDARQYGRLLVAVYERKTPGFAPYVAFVERPSNLERRIRRMTRRPRLFSVAGGAATIAAAVLMTTAWSAQAPVRRPVVPTVLGHRAANQVLQLGAVRTVAARSDRPIPLEPQLVQLTVRSSAELTPVAVVETPSYGEALSRAASAVAACGSGESTTNRTPSAPVGVDCSVDGDIVVMALDSARIFLAMRDTAAGSADRHSFLFVFTMAPGAVPASLAWSTATGHAEHRAGVWYIASPTPGTPPLVIAPNKTEVVERYPGAQRFSPTGVKVYVRWDVSWDLLKQLPTAARCAPDHRYDGPLFVIDGVVQNPPTVTSALQRGCFQIGGQFVELP